MAKPELTAEQKEIIRAQNDALLMLPADRAEYLALIEGYNIALARENDKISEARREIGSADIKRRLTDDNGLTPEAIRIIRMLDKASPVVRARTARQIIHHVEVKNYVVPDLFDKTAIGVGSNDTKGETAGFDATSEGRRRGGNKAQPPVQQRSTEQMAASNQRAIPQGPATYDEIVAAFTRAEDDWKANGAKPGRKPKAYTEAKEALDAANAERQAAGQPTSEEAIQTEAAAEPPAPPAAAEPPAPPPSNSNVVQLPTAKPGEVAAEMKEGAAAGDAFLAKQIEDSKKKGASGKASTSRKPKADKAAEAVPPPPPAPEPEAEANGDDDDDQAFPTGPGAGPLPPGRVGDRANTGRVV